jgi:IclR family acetate operon transcriptional repressor
MQVAPAHTGDVPALRKGLAVLELLAAEGPLTLLEIQRRGSLNKTMAFRVIRTLRETGYVDHDLHAHRYSLTLKLLKLGGAVVARLDVVAAGKPILDRLRAEFGETINLGVMDDGQVVYVAMAESSRPGLRMASRVGGHGCLHSTAMGKAILAYLPEAERNQLLTNLPRPRVTPSTLVDLEELHRELERTRERGYAIDNEENEVGARCVGVPILDDTGHPLAALSVSGPAARIADDALGAMANRLWRASREIAAALGNDDPTASLHSVTSRRSGAA